MGPDHTPLSKRHGATSVAEFRERGYLPEALVNYLALIGWSPGGDEELLPIDELARRFALEDVGHSAGVFDQEKLAWMNRHYMKAASPARLAAESARYFLGARLPPAADRRGDGVSHLGAADGGRLGRSARRDSRPAEVPVRFRSGRLARARGGVERAARAGGAPGDCGAAGRDRASARSIARHFARWRTV